MNMAMILDYDEDTLRRHMASRGLLKEVIDRRISEFKQKTLPSAKYFDDQRLLHLVSMNINGAFVMLQFLLGEYKSKHGSIQNTGAEIVHFFNIFHFIKKYRNVIL